MPRMRGMILTKARLSVPVPRAEGHSMSFLSAPLGGPAVLPVNVTSITRFCFSLYFTCPHGKEGDANDVLSPLNAKTVVFSHPPRLSSLARK